MGRGKTLMNGRVDLFNKIQKKIVINVIGLGYIGLPTALMFAAHGIEVVGTDYNIELVKTLQAGKTTFEEDGLDELFSDAISKGIKFSSEYMSTGVYIIAVPTPYDKFSKKIDPCYVIGAVKNVIEVCPKGATVIVESTIAPGTIDKFVRPIIEAKGFTIGEDVNLVHAPERIIPGNMVYELKHNSRTIGADNKEVGEKIKQLYSSFCQGDIVVTDIRTAEMTKVVENTFRDINIAFANELTKICRSGNMDVYEIIKIANMHPRVNILQPGPGVGGHCISVDPWFLVGDYPGLANIILAARKINDSMPRFVLVRVQDIMKEKDMTDLKRIGLYGLTYKENVDDVRESPTLQLLEVMEKHLAEHLKTYDPYVKEDIVKNQYHNFDEFLKDIDIIVIMVSHDEIKRNMDKLKGKVILDTKNICKIEGTYKL
jgi:nucleotide sugar dehydrogenase